MRMVEFARLVRDMRAKQQEFFDPRARRPSTLAESKGLERRVDKAVADILEGRRGLFDETED
jgi:hypothetical protein